MANARQFRLCRHRVNEERNEAFTQGVDIVEDEALPRRFVLEELPDEKHDGVSRGPIEGTQGMT